MNDGRNNTPNSNVTRLRPRPTPKTQRGNVPTVREPIDFRELRDLVLGTAVLGVSNIGRHFKEGAQGWKDFIRGENTGLRGSTFDRFIVGATAVVAISAGTNVGLNIYNEARTEPTAATALVDNTRGMELDTGHDRFQDRRSKIDAFEEGLSGVLPDSTLEKFDIAMSNPNDEVELRESLTADLDELISISQQASEVDLETDEAAALQVASRLSELEDKGFIDSTWRASGDSFLTKFRVALGNTVEEIGNGSVSTSPALQPPNNGRGI